MQVCFSLGYINFLLALFHPHTLQDSLKLDCGEQRFILAKQTTKLAIYLVVFGSFAKFNPEAGEIVFTSSSRITFYLLEFVFLNRD